MKYTKDIDKENFSSLFLKRITINLTPTTIFERNYLNEVVQFVNELRSCVKLPEKTMFAQETINMVNYKLLLLRKVLKE